MTIECPSKAWDRYYDQQERAEEEDPNMRIVNWNVDEARWVGDSEDGCYYLAGQHPKHNGWYVTVVVDSETGSFVDDLVVDDGPYPTESEAWQAGLNMGINWCLDNGVSFNG